MLIIKRKNSYKLFLRFNLQERPVEQSWGTLKMPKSKKSTAFGSSDPIAKIISSFIIDIMAYFVESNEIPEPRPTVPHPSTHLLDIPIVGSTLNFCGRFCARLNVAL